MNLDTLPSDQHLQSRWVAIEAATRKRSASRLRRTSLVGLLVVGLVGGSSFAAYAAHEASQQAENDRSGVAAQIALAPMLDENDDWFARFYDVAVSPAKAQPDEDDMPADYGGSAMDTKTKVLTVWWVGTPPDDVVDFFAEPTTEFTVKLESISVSKRALERASMTISSTDHRHHLVPGLSVVSVGHADSDRTSLVIEFELLGDEMPENGRADLIAAAQSLVSVKIAGANQVVTSDLVYRMESPFPDLPGQKPVDQTAIPWTGPSRD